MSSRIIENKKWKDLYNIKESEVKISLILTIIVLAVAIILDFHNSFIELEEAVKSVLSVFLGGLLAMLGFVLAGIAIVISLFDPKMLRMLRNLKKEKIVLQILISFEFSAFFIAVTVFIIVILYIAVSTNVPIINGIYFYGIFGLTVYSIIFNIFYIIALIGNCIRVYQISISFEELDFIERSLIDEANEIRIDYILNSLGKISNITREDLKHKLIEFAVNSEKDSKNEIIQYFSEYYK